MVVPSAAPASPVSIAADSVAPVPTAPISTALVSLTPVSTVPVSTALIVGLISSSVPGAIEEVRRVGSGGGEGSWLGRNADGGGTGVGAEGGIMYS